MCLPMVFDVIDSVLPLGVHGQVTDIGSQDADSGTELCVQEADLGCGEGLSVTTGGGNATHSNILAWRIPWAEEPGGPQSIGSHSRT